MKVKYRLPRQVTKVLDKWFWAAFWKLYDSRLFPKDNYHENMNRYGDSMSIWTDRSRKVSVVLGVENTLPIYTAVSWAKIVLYDLVVVVQLEDYRDDTSPFAETKPKVLQLLSNRRRLFGSYVHVCFSSNRGR